MTKAVKCFAKILHHRSSPEFQYSVANAGEYYTLHEKYIQILLFMVSISGV